MPVEIEKSTQKGKRYQIVTSDGERLRMSQETVFQYGIFEGVEFSDKKWFEILRAALESECFDKIQTYQSIRAHTELEIRRKLIKKSYPKEIISLAIEKAVSLQLLSDNQFAHLFVEEKLMSGQGRNKVKSEMIKRGVDKELINAAFEAFESSQNQEDGINREEQVLLELAERKWKALNREKDPQKRKYKFLSFLANRGFSSEQSYKAYDHCSGKSEDFDNWL